MHNCDAFLKWVLKYIDFVSHGTYLQYIVGHSLFSSVAGIEGWWAMQVWIEVQ